ncbi:PREDICTED: putative ferric-chelate reductase 1 [Branchiostoma belcheri]|uniref:Ferric-chelate reductase 1 n=1 Tax=Branchiostoma belcheri TaxID=7741 RepID=A0A6P4YPI6_BRABE|nr:PREDICTED: putative ferric-chelate reductase 1 [Branchiostoma belcheri]
MFLAVTVAVLMLSTQSVDGYSDASGLSGSYYCTSMTPSHGVAAQTSSPPYEIIVDKQTYSAGEQLTVTLQGTGSDTFKGFYVQARPVGQDDPVGMFTAIDATTTLLLDCGTGTQIITAEAPLGITTDGCGVTKGCYGVPDGCSALNCDFLSTWVTDAAGDNVIIEITGKSDGYVAIGFSHDQLMADDDMYECVRHPTDGNIEVFSSYSTGQSMPTREPANSGVTDVEVAYSNGLLSCRFHRAVRPTARAGAGADQYFDLGNSSYHIFLASGDTNVLTDGTVEIQVHRSRAYSDQPVDVTSISLVAAASAPILVKLHAALMMSAWMLTVSIGAVLARFYKPMWPNSTWCGVKIWFAGTKAEIHAIMGIIVTVLAVIQPFMSLLRGGPGEPKRRVFNWFHWAFGTGARVMAIIVMFLGLDFPAMDLPDEATYVLASWVAWQALSEVILEQEGLLKCCCESTAKVSDQEEIEMQAKKKSASSIDLNPEPKTPNPPNSCFKNGFLVIYMIVLTGFTVAMFTFIGLH